MRVAIVQEHVDVRRGGAETSTVEMARHLARLGLNVSVICRGDSGVPCVDEEVTFLPVAVRGVTRAGRTYRFVQAACDLCHRERFDIVHAVTPCLSANVYQPRGGTYGETIERSLAMVSCPLVRWLRRLGRLFNTRQRFLFRLERRLLRERRGRVFVAAVSEYVRRQVIAAAGKTPVVAEKGKRSVGSSFDPPPAPSLGGRGVGAGAFAETGASLPRVRVVFNGVDIAPLTAQERGEHRAALRAELRLDVGTPLVLFVAHNFKLKGLGELLRAAACAELGRYVVVVAGRDDARPYEQLARRLGIDARVRFVGTDTPVRAWYAAADALAHPTWYDPCSRVVLEALSVGLPVVTTSYNGAAEVMEPGRHGVVVDEPGDVEGLAAGLEQALQPAMRDACLADASRMHERLSMSRHARELKALYEEVLGVRT